MASITLYVAVNGDDVNWNGGMYGEGSLSLGYNSGGSAGKAYFRFPNLTLEQGTVINSAYITFTADANTAGTNAKVRFYGNDADNSVAPTSVAEGNALVLTTAYADITYGAWVLNTEYSSPDLKTLVQEIVDRAGWVSGNAIGFRIDENSGSNSPKYCYAYGDGSKYAKLVIDYEGPEQTIDSMIVLSQELSIGGTLNARPTLQSSIVPPLSIGGTIRKGGAWDIHTATINLSSLFSLSGTIQFIRPSIDGSLLLAPSISGTMSMDYSRSVAGTIDISSILSFSGTVNTPEVDYVDVSLVLPAITLAGEGLAGEFLDASLEIPALTTDTYGYDSCLGNLNSNIPKITAEGSAVDQCLGTLESSLPALTVTTAGYLIAIGNASLKLPPVEIVATLIQNENGTASLIYPGLTLTSDLVIGCTGNLDKSIPSSKLTTSGFLSALGNASIVSPALYTRTSVEPTTAYLAMVMNIKNKGLTEYDNYDFNSLCRFKGKHFGATATKIVELAGDTTPETDDGTPIEWNFRTGYIDQEQKTKKKVRSAWVSYKSTGDIMLTVVQPDGESFEYPLQGVFLDSEGGLRAKFGKGIKSKYIAIDVSNVDGSNIVLDVLKLYFENYKTPR